MFDTSRTSHPDNGCSLRRPHCNSPNTQLKNYRKRLGGALSLCTSVISSLSGATQGAHIGASFAFRATATTASLNSVIAAMLGALTGGAIGCMAGSNLGQVIDETVLDNHLCLRCHHSFQTP